MRSKTTGDREARRVLSASAALNTESESIRHPVPAEIVELFRAHPLRRKSIRAKISESAGSEGEYAIRAASADIRKFT